MAENPCADRRGTGAADAGTDDDLVVEDVLVEEVSIDGMCGVY